MQEWYGWPPKLETFVEHAPFFQSPSTLDAEEALSLITEAMDRREMTRHKFGYCHKPNRGGV